MRLPDDLILKDSTLKDQYFDLKGLSAYSSLSVTKLRTHIREDGLPCYKLGGKILVRQTEFHKWMANHRVNADADIDRIVDDVIGEINRRS